jgi:hypothetical protein
MSAALRLLALVGVILLSGCASPVFIDTWADSKATPLKFKGEKVVAVVVMKGEASRRVAEDRLAKKITARGAQGLAMYSLLPGANVSDEAATRAELEKAGVKGLIAIRPINTDKEVTSTHSTYYEPYYQNYWGGYYGYGWGSPYYGMGMGGSSNSTRVTETTVIYFETLVYSLPENKLVWAGRSKATYSDDLTTLVNDLAAATTSELKKAKLIK